MAYLAYHGLLNFSEVKETDYNFIAVVETPYIDAFKDIFTSVERVKKSKKIGYDRTANAYKVYLSKDKLVAPVTITQRRTNGKPDMRFHSNVLAARQTKFNAFFSTTISDIKQMRITSYKRILVNI